MAESNTPWTFSHVDADTNKTLLKHFRGERRGFIQVGEKKYLLPQKFGNGGVKYYKLKPRPSDTWVMSFPRSGTTWTQEMVWLIGNDLDFEKSEKVPLVKRFPFLEFDSCIDDEVLKELLAEAENGEIRDRLLDASRSITEDLENMKEGRFIKSHLPFSLLHPDLLKCGAKVIYVARNPKDVAVSYYNFHQFFKTLDYVGDFKTFWNFFEQDLELWTPYWEHINEAWQQRHNPNLLFLFYESLKKDLQGNIEKVCKFLGKQYSEHQTAALIRHLDFENFQNNKSVNMEIFRELGMLSNNKQRCVRQGKSGGWKEQFDSELNEQASKWIDKNLAKTGIIFPQDFKSL